MSARRISDEMRGAILKDYLDEVPGPVIAKRYGVHRNYAINLVRHRGLLSPRKLRRLQMWERAQEAAA